MLGLRVLRWIFGAACSVLGVWSAKYRFLGHYLWGSGENLKFPDRLIDWDAITATVIEQRDASEDGRYRLEDYTLDMEHGLLSQFLGGNEMFYVLATVEFSVTMDQFEKEYLIQGMDRYWWHENPDGSWPIGIRFGGWIGRVLRLFAPPDKKDAWFPFDERGGSGISNEFWADTTMVGAKVFYSIMAVNLDRAQWERMLEEAEARVKLR